MATAQERAKVQKEIDDARAKKAAEQAERNRLNMERLEEMRRQNSPEARQKRVEAEAQRKREEEDRRVIARLRTRYLTAPGTTEESFRAALPVLLTAYANRTALGEEFDLPVAQDEWADKKKWGIR